MNRHFHSQDIVIVGTSHLLMIYSDIAIEHSDVLIMTHPYVYMYIQYTYLYIIISIDANPKAIES